MLTSRPRYKQHQSGGINSSLPVKPSDAIQNSISRAALFPTVQCSAWRAPWGATFEQGGHQQQWSLMTCVSSCMGHTDRLNPPLLKPPMYVLLSLVLPGQMELHSHPVHSLSCYTFRFPSNSTSYEFYLSWGETNPSQCCNAVSYHPPTQGRWVSLRPLNTRGGCPHVGGTSWGALEFFKETLVATKPSWQKCQFNSHLTNSS